MQLDERVIVPGCFRYGREAFSLSAGEKVRVQKYVDGSIVDVLPEATVPAGKSWTVVSIIEVTETDE